MDKLPALTGSDRLCILAPHPDDEALATGGLLQRAAAAGAQTRVVFLTDGDDNPWPQRVIERRWRVSGPEARARWGRLRRDEALASLATLGHGLPAAEFWALPDRGLTRLLTAGGEALVPRLREAVAAWAPTWLVVPSCGDRHPDHSALGVAVALAMEDFRPERPPLGLSYVVHGDPHAGPSLVRCLALSDGERDAKRQAILRHRSQILLSRERFLAHARSEECYGIEPSPDAPGAVPSGPGRVQWDERGLWLRLPLRLPRWKSGTARVELLTESVSGRLRHARPAVFLCRQTGRACVPRAFVRGDLRQVFIRVITGFGLYDSDGWNAYRLDRLIS